MTPEILGSARGPLAPTMASVTFGVADLSTVHLGSLAGTTIQCFRSPVPGLPLAHWHAPPSVPPEAVVVPDGSGTRASGVDRLEEVPLPRLELPEVPGTRIVREEVAIE